MPMPLLTSYLLDGLVHCYAAAIVCPAFCAAWARLTPTRTADALTCLTCIDYMSEEPDVRRALNPAVY